MEDLSQQCVKPFLQTLQIDGVTDQWEAYLKAYLSPPPPVQTQPPPNTKAVGKKTGYQIFFSERSSVLRKERPGIEFREISQTISEEWKRLTNEERQMYKSTADLQKDSNHPKDSKDTNIPTDPSKDPTNPREWKKENLVDLSMAELHKICEEFKLTKRGNKTVVIQRILDSKPSSPTETVKPPGLEGEALRVLRKLREKNPSILPFGRRRQDNLMREVTASMPPPVMIRSIQAVATLPKPVVSEALEDDLPEEDEVSEEDLPEEELIGGHDDLDQENEENEDNENPVLLGEEDELEEEEVEMMEEDDIMFEEGPDLIGDP